MSLAQRLAGRLHGRVVVVGTGNPLRGDDAAGSLVARRLACRHERVIDAEDVPESILGEVIASAPTTVAFVDAVDMGAPAGSVALLEPQQLAGYWPSTHRSSLALLASYLGQAAAADVVVLGIQPAQLGWRVPLSREVGEAVSCVVALLSGFLPARRDAAERPGVATQEGRLAC